MSNIIQINSNKKRPTNDLVNLTNQLSFEITISNRDNFQGNIEINNDNDENNQTRRICVINKISY